MSIKKLSTSGLFIAMGVALSFFYIPIGAAKCFPIQHMINVLSAVLLGPVYAVSIAFATSLIRVLMSTGSFLAFPGSMIGALLSGLLYRKTKKLSMAYLGEAFGTGILGALAAYPVAALIMGREVAAFAFVIPFLISTAVGALLGVILIKGIERTGVLDAPKQL